MKFLPLNYLSSKSLILEYLIVGVTVALSIPTVFISSPFPILAFIFQKI